MAESAEVSASAAAPVAAMSCARNCLRLGQTVVTDGAFLMKSDVLRSKMGAGCAD